MPNYSHDLHNLFDEPVVDALRAAYATTVAIANVVDSRIHVRLLGDALKVLEECHEIGVRLFFAVTLNAPLVDADQIFFGVLGQPKASHCGGALSSRQQVSLQVFVRKVRLPQP